MGQRLSLRSSQANYKPECKRTKRYPLPIENQMLQQIRKDYQASKEVDSGTGDLLKGDEILHIDLLEEQNAKNVVGLANLQLGSDSCDHFFKYEDNQADAFEEDEPFNIINLPILVVERLLDYLNPLAILALRATCKTTKAWIDWNDYILRDFEMRIEPEVCKYHTEPPHTSPWSNFAIPFVHLQSDFIQDTIDNFSDIIWSLDIYSPKTLCSTGNYPSNHPSTLFEIIGRCHQLQRLKICRFDTLTQIPEGNESFQCLRVLSIDRIQWMNHGDFLLFHNLIMKCPNLEYLKVPEYEILGSLAFIYFDQNASPEKEHLIRPIIQYLDYYRCPSENKVVSKQRQQTKLYIDVVEFEDFKLCSSEIFYELSRKCLECNAVLMNVYFVPRDAVLRNEQNIVESFASMFGFIKIDFRAELWKNLEVMECWIEEFPEDLELTMRQFEFLKTVSKIEKLRSLTIRMSVDDPDICSRALEACVGQQYKGIKKLILRRHQVTPDSYVKIPSGFGQAFCNLRFIYFQELDSRNEDFQRLWPTLNNLEELFVYKCSHLTQEAFIGSGSEEHDIPLLKLTSTAITIVSS